MKRRNSEILLRNVYPPVFYEEEQDYESEVQKILNNKMKTDKRYFGSIICASIVLFFLVILGITFIFAIIPAAIGACCIGNALGRYFKRQKLQSSMMSKESKYLMRLSSILLYLKKLKRSKISPQSFQGILERAFEEFLPALVLQIYEPKFSKELRRLTNFLKSSAVHTCILNYAALLEDSIALQESLSVNAYRLRNFFIPVMHLLKKPENKQNQELEVVRKIADILAKEETQMMLLRNSSENDKLVKFITKYPFLSSCGTESYPISKIISDIQSINSPSLPIASPTFRLYRRNSLSELDFIYSSPDKELILNTLSSAGRAFKANPNLNEDSIFMSHNEPHSPKQIFLNSPPKNFLSSIDSQPLLLPKPRSSMLNVENMQDLDDSENNSIKDSDKESEQDIDRDNLGDQESSQYAIPFIIHLSSEDHGDSAMRLHPYMDCFEVLLNIEKEPNSETIWKQVVNKPGTQVYQKKTGDSPICMIKAFCNINYSAHTVYSAIWDTETRTKWDVIFNEFRLIDKQPDYEVLYYMIKTPFGITKRDWLQRRVEIHEFPEPGTIILHFISIEHPGMPPKKGVIRAETLISGYIIRPTSDRTCSVTIVSQNDIKGLIPKVLVNSVASKAPVDWVNGLNRGCKLVAGY